MQDKRFAARLENETNQAVLYLNRHGNRIVHSGQFKQRRSFDFRRLNPKRRCSFSAVLVEFNNTLEKRLAEHENVKRNPEWSFQLRNVNPE